MSSYPPGGDYDERLLDNIPKATKAERQEGYNVNLLASDTSESPMNARPPPTVDGHTSVEAGTPPTKEGYISYSVPWHRQKKWRIFMFIGAILLVGAIAGGVAGGVVASKNRSKSPSTTPTQTSSSAFNAPTANTSASGALPPVSQPPVANASSGTAPTPTGVNGIGPSRISTLNLSGDNFNDTTDPGQVSAPVVVWSD